MKPLSDKFDNIKITDTNILSLVESNSVDFLKFIIINHIFNKTYYGALYKNITINQMIKNMIESGKAKLNDDIIEYLYSYNKNLIENIEGLDAIEGTKISQKSIDKFKNLKILIASNNKKIKNVNHLSKTLIKLNASGDMCGIDQTGINNLKHLKTLIVSDNLKIINVNHLGNTLVKLDASCSGINQNGICHLKVLKKLNASCNQQITNVNHLQNTLQTLEIGSHPQCGPSGINYDGVAELKKLKFFGGYCPSVCDFFWSNI